MRFKKVVLLFLSVCICFCTTACGKNEKMEVVSGQIDTENQPLTQSNSSYDKQLLHNPDRGFRMEVRLSNFWDNSNITKSLDFWSLYYKSDNPQLVQTYFYLKDLPDALPQKVFDKMQEYFDACREKNIKILLRFAYQTDMEVTTPGDKSEAKMSTMLAHIGQLNPILEKNKDVIHVVQMGFIGAWGEWHSYSDLDDYEIDETALTKAVVDMVPDELFIQMRYIVDHDSQSSFLGEKYSKRLAFHNDGIIGTKLFKECFGTPYWDYKTSLAAFAPQDGEIMWGGETYNKVMPSLPYYAFAENDPKTKELKWSNLVGELVEHCYTSMSLHHSYKEIEINDGTRPPYTMQFWKERDITAKDLDALGFYYSPGWFQNKKGKNIKRNQFEYVRDYLGYRIGLNTYSINGELKKGENLDVSLNLTNYGFSAAFNITSGFAVLDQNNKVVSFVKAGTPSEWYSRKPGTKAVYDTAFSYFPESNPLSHTVSSSITLPETAGTYKIAFGAFSTNNCPIYFANDMTVIDGYHVLSVVEVK